MQQEIRFATFNVCNLALPGEKFYEDQEPYSTDDYEAKTSWIAAQIDKLDADVIAFQEIFSQRALHDVLFKSQKYRQAQHVGFDVAPRSPPSPGLALVSRLPIAPGARTIAALPDGLSVPLPGVPEPLTRFTRPVLHARVVLPQGTSVDVFVCHLKSKRPDYRNDQGEINHGEFGIASLRSLIRRSTDALGLRLLVSDCIAQARGAVIALGDFNDCADAVSTQLIMGNKNGPDDLLMDRLFDSYRIQSSRGSLRDVGYTHVHEDKYETVDHVLVSSHFHPQSTSALGEVLEVIYMNDHLAIKCPGASDHGLVLVRIGLHAPKVEDGSTGLPLL